MRHDDHAEWIGAALEGMPVRLEVPELHDWKFENRLAAPKGGIEPAGTPLGVFVGQNDEAGGRTVNVIV